MNTRRRVPLTVSVCLLAALAAGGLAADPFSIDPAAAYTSNPTVASRPEGGFLIAWTRDRRMPLSFGPDAFVPQTVSWRRLHRDGSLDGAAFEAGNAGPTGAMVAPRAVADGAGAQLVWGRFLPSGFRIEGRRVHPTRRVATLAACADGQLRGLRLLPADQQSWLIWNESCDGLRVIGQRLDARGRPTGLARVLVGTSALVSRAFDFAASARGLVGAWTQRLVVGTGEERALVARSYRPDGRPRGVLFRVDTASPDIAVLGHDNGDLWIAWRRGNRVVVRGFREHGEARGPALPAGTLDEVSERMPHWSNVTGGQAILVWQRSGDAQAPTCVARRFDRLGPVGSELPVAEHCVNPSVARSGGSSLVVWQEPNNPPDPGAGWRAVGRMVLASEW